MQTCKLLENLEFHDSRSLAEPLLVHERGRVIRFSLRAGQHIREHRAPHSSVHIVVVRGTGFFAGEDGAKERAGAGDVVVFGAGELHRVRAETDLVFAAILEPAPPPQVRAAPQPEADAYLTWQM